MAASKRFARIKAVELRNQHPEFKLIDIAKECHVTRERIRQILKAEELPTRHALKTRYCKYCGLELPVRPVRRYCSESCRNAAIAAKQVILTCEYCGSPYTKPKALYNSILRRGRHTSRFCCNRCQGLWLAKNHGFPAHPENKGSNKTKGIRKWDENEIIEMRKQGKTYREIKEAIGIPYCTLSSYITRLIRDGVFEKYPGLDRMRELGKLGAQVRWGTLQTV